MTDYLIYEMKRWWCADKLVGRGRGPELGREGDGRQGERNGADDQSQHQSARQCDCGTVELARGAEVEEGRDLSGAFLQPFVVFCYLLHGAVWLG